jgi:hypothetical protein
VEKNQGSFPIDGNSVRNYSPRFKCRTPEPPDACPLPSPTTPPAVPRREGQHLTKSVDTTLAVHT